MGREGDKPLVESRDPNEEQHPGVSVGLIRVQEILLGPGAVEGAQSHLSTGVPRTALVTLKGTGTSAPPLHRDSAQLLLDSPGDALLSSRQHTKLWGQHRARLCSEQGGSAPFQLPHAPLRGPGQAKKGHPG